MKKSNNIISSLRTSVTQQNSQKSNSRNQINTNDENSQKNRNQNLIENKNKNLLINGNGNTCNSTENKNQSQQTSKANANSISPRPIIKTHNYTTDKNRTPPRKFSQPSSSSPPLLIQNLKYKLRHKMNSNNMNDPENQLLTSNNSPVNNEHTNNAHENDDKYYPGETQTFVSATTDMSHFSQENLAKFPKERFSAITCDGQFITTCFITFITYLSPILFLLIPIFKQNLSHQNSCYGVNKIDCQTDVLTIILKLVVLSIISYWIFWQKSRIIYPRTHWPRAICLALMLIMTAIFWLFYAVKIMGRTNVSMDSAILFSKNCVDVLFYIHIVAIIIIELRLVSKNSETEFLVEMIRSTDGEQRFYNLGEITIQEAAYLLLQNYYRDFPLNNPAAFVMGNVSSKKKANHHLHNDSTTVNNTKLNAQMSQLSPQEFKIYNLDSAGALNANHRNQNVTGASMLSEQTNRNEAFNTELEASNLAIEQSKKVLQASRDRKSKKDDVNDLYYDQLEWERHIRKRKCRLEISAEKTFEKLVRRENHLGSHNHGNGFSDHFTSNFDPQSKKYRKHGSRNYHGHGRGDHEGHKNIMDANEAATVLFPSLARPLQKYLRTTRQHLHYSLASTTSHLSQSFQHGLSYRAFMQRYLKPRPQLAYPAYSIPNQDLDGDSCEWNLCSEKPLTESLSDRTIFSLQGNDFSLVVTCYRHPKILLTESMPNSRMKFSLKV